MSSPWFNVPFLHCRMRFDVAHAWRRSDPKEGPKANVWHHSANYTVAATFRLQLRKDDWMRPTFHHPKVTFRVTGWAEWGMSEGNQGPLWSRGRRTFSGSTGVGPATLTLYVDEGHVASLSVGELINGSSGLPLKYTEQNWLGGAGGKASKEEGVIGLLLQQPFPTEPGPVRLAAKPKHLSLSTPFCLGVSACEEPVVSGSIRLTPGLPTFRIVDDTVDQNPIPHCRLRVLCPDGAERECVTDEEGEVFLPRTGKDVYTLLEVLRGGAPFNLAEQGPWTVDAGPDVAA
ncbi:MAG: hypothetical protein EOO71_23215 [Myxococcaceae bacterium]|nr:MAG: hypothetical protein EOO71_23215 [Myxococcaceae bacterium]